MIALSSRYNGIPQDRPILFQSATAIAAHVDAQCSDALDPNMTGDDGINSAARQDMNVRHTCPAYPLIALFRDEGHKAGIGRHSGIVRLPLGLQTLEQAQIGDIRADPGKRGAVAVAQAVRVVADAGSGSGSGSECMVSTECMLVPEDCCDCAHGGAMRAVSKSAYAKISATVKAPVPLTKPSQF